MIKQPLEKQLEILIGLVLLLSGLALFNEVMEPDGALYASIAKNMVLRNDWLNLYVRGADWLDKPHLPFWLAALSFKLFGISAFAYKLPSFLISLLGSFYLYRFVKEYYTRETALVSTLIFLTALHVLISNSDVRAEGYLTAFIIAAIYHYNKSREQSFLHLIAGSFFAACAVMVKGIFVLLPVFGGGILFCLLTNNRAKELLNPRWQVAIALIAIFITPELCALYTQFDLHPEKVVFGQQGVSGLKFFLWDSQFGRFFNTGPIKGKGDLSFFLHTTLWAFLPWSILFYAGAADLFKKSYRMVMPAETVVVWSSALLTFLLFSFSKFQLPHYVLVIFPQFAIITALYLFSLKEKGIKVFFIIQNVVCIIVTVLLAAIAVCFRFSLYGLAIGILLLLIGAAFLIFRGPKLSTILGRGAVLSTGIMAFLYLFFYPALLKYQAGMKAGQWLSKNEPGARPAVYGYNQHFSFDFYARGEVQYLYTEADLEKALQQNNLVLYMAGADLATFKSKYRLQVLKAFDYYHITKLKAKFIMADSRASVLERFYLVRSMK